MRPPSSTYRLQFNSAFTFKDASRVMEYLHALGIGAVYASPVFKARKGSLHGYDIVDHGRVNPELGTLEELEGLFKRAASLGMGWVQDIVPNHMAYDGSNPLLVDVLEKGRQSAYSGFFDIEWDHPYEGIRDKVLAPFLGRPYGEALEAGEISVGYGADGFKAHYYSISLPLKIDSYIHILGHNLRRLQFQLGREHPDYIKLLGVFYVLKNLPAGAGDKELDDQVTFVKRMLWELYAKNGEMRGHIDASLAAFNGSGGGPEGFNLLDRLLSEQFFKLSFWKVAAEEINYRRFFNINELITLRAEEEGVFDSVHDLALRLLSMGATGIRVDHVDGLLNPLKYLKRLRERAPGAYITVEKILAEGEELPFAWPVEGTTGYDFLAGLNGIYCETSNEARFTRIYSSFTGGSPGYGELFYRKKKLIAEMEMMSDVGNLAQLLKLTLANDRHGSDFTLQGLRRAVVEVMASFQVYRTYICAESFTDTDAAYIKEAVSDAIARNPALVNEIAFTGRVLTLRYREYLGTDEKKEWLRFVMRFQQFTGPLTAKGVEDTLFYVYNRLISLNEVGASPGVFGSLPEAFHARNLRASLRRPFSMNATSTHDTKRGEDARARINVLSEMPSEWEAAVRRWSAIARKMYKGARGGPDRNDEYFLYQTLIGSFPFNPGELPAYRERLRQYMTKAVREAKIHTAWLKPDAEYEGAFLAFAGRLLEGGPEENPFLRDFLPFQRKVAWYGMINSLSQTLLKIASPGVPDFYQGTELWDLSFVDPDNRRAVDFDKRRQMLECVSRAIEDGSAPAVFLEAPEDGRVKLFLIYAALKARGLTEGLFNGGSYVPLAASGAHAGRVVALARVASDGGAAIAAAPRLSTRLAPPGAWPLSGLWGDTAIALPEGLRGRTWKDAFTGKALHAEEAIGAASLFSSFPVALLGAS